MEDDWPRTETKINNKGFFRLLKNSDRYHGRKGDINVKLSKRKSKSLIGNYSFILNILC